MKTEPSRTVVHIVEIRLSDTDAWQICDAFSHPVEGMLGTTVADIANKVQAHTRSHGDECKTIATRTLSGDLVRAEIIVDHDSGSSFFRHTIREAHSPGPWLDIKATTPSHQPIEETKA